jgi:hypothetical protein
MNTISKLALGGLMLAGAAAATTAPASAGVVVGVNFGVPGLAVYGGYPYGYPNVCYRPYWYRPAWCGGYQVYGEPLFVDGGWYTSPVYYRYYGGARYFWLHNGWVADRDDFHRDFQGNGYRAGFNAGRDAWADHRAAWAAHRDAWGDHRDGWAGYHNAWANHHDAWADHRQAERR